MGADVTLVSTFKADKPYKNIVTETALEMEKAVKENLSGQDCVIMAAAVSDYRVENCAENKIKKQGGVLELKLVENPDILKEISQLCSDNRSTCVEECANKPVTGANEEHLEVQYKNGNTRLCSDNRSTYVVGFCAESENLLENAKAKIQKKGCDFLIANDISRKDIGFNTDENEVYIIDKSLNIKHIEKDTKENIARRILEEIFE